MPKNILFVYNQVSRKQKTGLFRECILDDDVKTIRKALLKTKYNILPLDLYNPKQLNNFIIENYPIDFAFVLAEGYKDYPYTLYDGSGTVRVRKQLEAHKIPYSHSGIEGMETCRNKELTYEKLQEYNISTHKYFVIDLRNRFRKKQLLQKIDCIGYPLMVKPAGGGDSIGITPKSVVHNIVELKRKIGYLKRTLGSGKLIIEQYLPGTEFTIAILGNEERFVLPIIAFPKNWGIRYTGKKNKEYTIREQFKIVGENHTLFSSLVNISVKSFQAVRANDIIRLDIKKDKDGNLYVIDINGSPSLSPRSSVAFMASKLNLSHSQLVKIIFYGSMIRNNLLHSEYMEELIAPVKEKLQPFVYNQLIEVFSRNNEI